MVFVKVRETYDLKTVQNKMTVIAVHTPKPDIIKKNYPGLLMQCKAYRPVSADVRVACASVLPLDPLGIGTTEGSVAPEDVFNPILYKATTNFGMSQIEARIAAMATAPDPSIAGADVVGQQAIVDVDSAIDGVNNFDVYYGLLANTHDWKHANPQSGLEMRNLKPLVWEMVYNIGDNAAIDEVDDQFIAPTGLLAGPKQTIAACGVRGNAKPMPFINTTVYSYTSAKADGGYAAPGFPVSQAKGISANCELDVPYLPVVCAAIIVPPSKLSSFYYRMVIEWTIEFSSIRPLSEITNWVDLGYYGQSTHFQNYSYEETKKALTGSSDTILESDQTMVSANVDIKKVM